MMDLARLTTVANHAVGIATQLVRDSSPQEIREKGDRDIVTDVDIKVEQEIRAYLHRVTPGIPVLGEEEGRDGNDDSEDMWALDPIDGTSNFAHGLPLCAVSLALVRNGAPVIGVITAPFLDLHYSAVKGLGAYANANRMHASRTGDLAKAIVSIGDYAVGANADEKNKRRLRLTSLLAERVERVRMFGSAALDLAWVAEGRTDATVILANKPWDTAAGVLLAREAGALVTEASGKSHSFASSETIAASSGIYDSLLSIVDVALAMSPG